MVEFGSSHIRVGSPAFDPGPEDDLALLVGVGDYFGGGGQVGRHSALEVERHSRVGREIGNPIPWKAGSASEVEDAIEIVEIDLDSPSLAALAAGCGYVDDAALDQGLFDGWIHIAWNQTGA